MSVQQIYSVNTDLHFKKSTAYHFRNCSYATWLTKLERRKACVPVTNVSDVHEYISSLI